MKNLVLALLLLCTLALTACKEEGGQNVTENIVYNRVMETGKLRCGYLPWPPFLVKDINSGELKGPIADYINRLGEVLDLEIIWETELNLSTYLQDLNNHRYDIECSGGWANAIRGKYAHYTDTIFYMPFQILKRKGDNRFNGIEDLNNSKYIMAIMDGENSAATKKLRFPDADVFEIPSSGQVSDLMLAVTTNKADFTIVNTPSAYSFMESNPDQAELFDKPLKFIPIAITIAQGEDNLKEMLNVATQQLVLSGEIDLILDEHDPEQKIYIREQKPYEVGK